MKKLVLALMLLAPTAMFAQKFGHLNAQEVMSGMPEFIKARGELEAKAKQFENELQDMQKELQKKSEDYDKQKATMNATKQQEVEAELQTLYGKIQQAYQDNQQALQKEQQEKMEPITNKLITAIENVGKNGGYVYIMDVTAGIPYISKTLSKDVTADVKTELNKIK